MYHQQLTEQQTITMYLQEAPKILLRDAAAAFQCHYASVIQELLVSEQPDCYYQKRTKDQDVTQQHLETCSTALHGCWFRA